MATITVERRQLMHGAISDLWATIKAFDSLEDTDGYWETLVDDIGMNVNKYGNDPLVKALFLAFLEVKEAESKSRKEKHGANSMAAERPHV